MRPFIRLVPAAARGNVTSLAPDSDALLDSNAGDYFPAYMRHHGYDHIVLYGRNEQWTLLEISRDRVRFHDATPYVGMDNLDFTAAVERDLASGDLHPMQAKMVLAREIVSMYYGDAVAADGTILGARIESIVTGAADSAEGAADEILDERENRVDGDREADVLGAAC